LDYEKLAPFDPERKKNTEDTVEQINIYIKYDGYIKRQMKQVEQFKKLETKKLDENFDYNKISGLRNEAKQKLNLYKPASIGQASRISGVSPADVSGDFSIYGTKQGTNMKRIEEIIGFPLTEKQVNQFEKYYEYLIEKNK
jgi:tRNA U34 5-carboxymethylaminomethyl modifying enzyme MnmG/GidA